MKRSECDWRATSVLRVEAVKDPETQNWDEILVVVNNVRTYVWYIHSGNYNKHASCVSWSAKEGSHRSHQHRVDWRHLTPFGAIIAFRVVFHHQKNSPPKKNCKTRFDEIRSTSYFVFLFVIRNLEFFVFFFCDGRRPRRPSLPSAIATVLFEYLRVRLGVRDPNCFHLLIKWYLCPLSGLLADSTMEAHREQLESYHGMLMNEPRLERVLHWRWIVKLLHLLEVALGPQICLIVSTSHDSRISFRCVAS